MTADASVVGQLLAGKQGFSEAELAQIANTPGIENSVEVVYFVLHDAGVEVADRAIDGRSCGIKAGIAQIPIPWHEPAHAGDR